MTKLLEKAIDQVSALPEDVQDEFAEWMISELESERRWNAAFAGSSDALSKLARAVLEEDNAGLTERLDPDTL